MFNYLKPILTPILICSLFIYGCESVKTYYVEKENIPKDEVVRIKGVFLKSGGFIDLQNKNAKLVMTGESKGINYDSTDMKRNNIAIDNIGVLKIEVASNNYLMPIAIIGGVAAVFFIALIIIVHGNGFGNWKQ